MDQTGRTFQRERTFKAYLTNPTMRAALFSPVKDGDEAMGSLTETAIFSQWFQSRQIRDIRYARWKQNRRDMEVDLVSISRAIKSPCGPMRLNGQIGVWSDQVS